MMENGDKEVADVIREDRQLDGSFNPFEVGEDHFSADQDLADVDDLEEFALKFVAKVAKLRLVRIDRAGFLKTELHKRGFSREIIEQAIDENPVFAGVPVAVLDDIAKNSISFETRKSSAYSFGAGLPGGFAMFATVPTDITQFYVHAFRIMQKVSYVYGGQEFLSDLDELDDETLGKITLFLGVMMGVGSASVALSQFLIQVARPAAEKQIAKQALTKTVWYLPMKQVLRMVGGQVTKTSFAKGVTKVIPIAGGFLSAGLTYITLGNQSQRLMLHIREIPPPNVDAAEYIRKIQPLVIDEEDSGPNVGERIRDKTGKVVGGAFAKRKRDREDERNHSDSHGVGDATSEQETGPVLHSPTSATTREWKIPFRKRGKESEGGSDTDQ